MADDSWKIKKEQFNADAYLKQNTDVAKDSFYGANADNAYQHYLNAGADENKQGLRKLGFDVAPTVTQPNNAELLASLKSLQDKMNTQPSYEQMKADSQAQMQALKDAQISNSLAGLEASRNKSTQAVNAEKSQIAPQYQGLRNVSATQSDIKVKNFAEYLANKGALGAGTNNQIRASMDIAGLQNQSNLYRQEQLANDDISRRLTGIEQDYNTGVQQAKSGADVQFIQNTLGELGTLRNYAREDARNSINDAMNLYGLQYQQGRDAVGDNQWNQQFNNTVSQQNKDNARADAGLTGTYNGQTTLAGKQLSMAETAQAFDQAMAIKNYDLNSAQQAFTQDLQTKGFTADEAQKAWDNNYREQQTRIDNNQTALDNAFRDKQYNQQVYQASLDEKFRIGQFDYQKEQDYLNRQDSNSQFTKQYQLQLDQFTQDKMQQGWEQQFKQGQFDYQKTRDAVADKQYSDEMKLKVDEFAWSKSGSNPQVQAQIIANRINSANAYIAETEKKSINEQTKIKTATMKAELAKATEDAKSASLENNPAIQKAKLNEANTRVSLINAQIATEKAQQANYYASANKTDASSTTDKVPTYSDATGFIEKNFSTTSSTKTGDAINGTTTNKKVYDTTKVASYLGELQSQGVDETTLINLAKAYGVPYAK